MMDRLLDASLSLSAAQTWSASMLHRPSFARLMIFDIGMLVSDGIFLTYRSAGMTPATSR
jgi:hypothetical protein